jgi:hypothetical protein
MSEELKKCSFCGSSVKVRMRDGKVSCSSIFCPLYSINIDENIWQSRPLEDALRKQLVQVHGILARTKYDPFYSKDKGIDDALAEIDHLSATSETK